MNIKEKLLSEILDSYARLKPSPVAGIGVFAIRDIPKGCRTIFDNDKGEWSKVPVAEVAALPTEIRELVENYCTFDREYYYVESRGFKRFDLAQFLNHSDSPNIEPVNDGEFFEANRDIKNGEELFIDYGVIAEE